MRVLLTLFCTDSAILSTVLMMSPSILFGTSYARSTNSCSAKDTQAKASSPQVENLVVHGSLCKKRADKPELPPKSEEFLQQAQDKSSAVRAYGVERTSET